MSNATISPNMGLTIPTVAEAPGPDWADDINASLTIVDGHNHTPGNGVQITPDGININSDLPMQSNNLTVARSVRLDPQNSTLALTTDIGCVYESGVDLYYNDGNGTPIRITQSGAVAGTPGSIANLAPPASASYNAISSTFIFQSDALTPANIDAASYVLRNLSASSFGITLSPPNSLSSDYTITLPALPASTLPVSISSVGAMSAAQVTTSQIANNAITTPLIADANVTRPKLIAVGQQISSGSGDINGVGGSYSDVHNLSVTITTTGRPVMLMLNSDPSVAGTGAITGVGITGFYTPPGSAEYLQLAFLKGATIISEQVILASSGFNSGSGFTVPPSTIMYLDTPTAGTYTYKVQAQQSIGFSFAGLIRNVVLVAYEL